MSCLRCIAVVVVLGIAAAAFGPLAAQPPKDEPLKEQAERAKIAEQRMMKAVETLLNKVKPPLTDPAQNLKELRALLDRVTNDPDLSEATQRDLTRRLRRMIAEINEALATMPGQEKPKFVFKIPAKTPIESLLPALPRYERKAGPLATDDLAKVPELMLEAPATKPMPINASRKAIAHLLAKVNHANAKKRDGYMEALLAKRTDLAALPFVMGDDCRLTATRNFEFQSAVIMVHSHIAVQQGKRPEAAARLDSEKMESVVSQTQDVQGDPNDVIGPMWEEFRNTCAAQDKENARRDAKEQDEALRSSVAALMQIVGPAGGAMRMHLVKYLATLQHTEATRALAKLAIYSEEEDARKLALKALKLRRERDYTDILIAGLRYPWPAVARRAAEAVIALERVDLIPQLVTMLEEADPRLPVAKKVGDTTVLAVREVVKINHHRNCVLCHAPGNVPNQNTSVFTASIPVPGEPLPSGYGPSDSPPDLAVRVDVTYLRQDFSLFLPVADAQPWPEFQRFDFVVQTRTVSEAEAKAFHEALTPREPGVLTPYHRAVLLALRELTGRDTAPTAAAWRELVKLPAK